MSDFSKPAAFKAAAQGSMVRLTKASTICSNLARERERTRCFGTPSTGMMYGKLISELVVLDNSIFAFSAASFKRCNAMGSLERSKPPFSSLNSFTNHSMMAWSKSSPPRWVSPSVESTSNTPSPNSKMETSCVPPPRSNTTIFWSMDFLSMPYANAAAVGSLMIRFTSSPAISPASFVACRWASLK